MDQLGLLLLACLFFFVGCFQDLKPENLLLMRKPQRPDSLSDILIKLADFGLAQRIPGELKSTLG